MRKAQGPLLGLEGPGPALGEVVLKPSVSWVGLGSTGDWGAEVLEEQLLQRQGFGKRRKQERKTLSVLLLNPWSSCCSLWLAWTRATFGSQTCPISWEPESKELRDAGDQGGSLGNWGRADTRAHTGSLTIISVWWLYSQVENHNHF